MLWGYKHTCQAAAVKLLSLDNRELSYINTKIRAAVSQVDVMLVQWHSEVNYLTAALHQHQEQLETFRNHYEWERSHRVYLEGVLAAMQNVSL